MSGVRNWVWFIGLMVLILGAGLYMGKSRRRELGKSFTYSLEDYRKVDPALILYAENRPIGSVYHEHFRPLDCIRREDLRGGRTRG